MAVEADEPRAPIRALSLLGVLVVARLFTLSSRDFTLSVWFPIAYLWQDLLTAMLFAAFERSAAAMRARWFAGAIYAAMALYVAINVAVSRVLFTPLTPTMIHAAGGPLFDSIRYYFTPANAAAIGFTLGAAIVLPIVLRRVRQRLRLAWVLPALAIVALGPFSVSKVETSGRHRNAFGAILPMRVQPGEIKGSRSMDLRLSPFSTAAIDDLARYRGAATGRNVVMVSLESAGAMYLRPFGAAIDPMPNLTKLASNALVFENAYAAYPESIKGFLSVLCSRLPAFNVAAEAYAQVQCPALSKQLAAAGYRTALFHSGRFVYLGMESIVKNRGFDVLEDAGAIGGNIESSFGVDEPAAVERTLKWIDSIPKGQPFFLVYLPIAGHHPYPTPGPGPFPVRDDRDRYLNALNYGDKSLGDLLHGLQERGLAQDTLFVIYGDHGEAFQQHSGNVGHTMFVYEENVHVPLVIAAPGLINRPIAVRRTASLIDVAPTILDVLGLPVPAEFQGASLFDPEQRMAFFFTDYSLGLLGLVDACWKYIYETDSERSKLFEICRDPAEKVDVSDWNPDRVKLYRERVLLSRALHGDAGSARAPSNPRLK